MILATIVTEANGMPTDYYPWLMVGLVFICIVALAVGANAVDDFLDRRKTKPGVPPNEQLQASLAHLTSDVQKLSEALKEHVAFNHQEHDGIFKKIGGVEHGAQQKLEAAIASGNESREKLHQRINDCVETMGELRGSIQTLLSRLK